MQFHLQAGGHERRPRIGLEESHSRLQVEQGCDLFLQPARPISASWHRTNLPVRTAEHSPTAWPVTCWACRSLN